MSLKQYLKKTLDEKIEEYKSGTDLTEESLRILEQTKTNTANYVVYLRSLWENEGERSTTTVYHGTLRKAIEVAEAEFKKRNNRSDVQASWLVDICLGTSRYSIPEQYWKKYREK